MSANAGALRSSGLIGSFTCETTLPTAEGLRETNEWNAEDFAREQIRGLVQRVFLAGGARPVKQVVFSAVESNTDIANLCDRVGRALALETRSDIAIVGREPGEMIQSHSSRPQGPAIKSWASQVTDNVWRVPEAGLRESSEQSGTGLYWLSSLAKLRNEFEYAVIHGPAAGTSSEAALMGHLADGIILVLGAHSTRKATARKIKETLEGAQSRILGTVLSERTFPVPERIYRRL
jgi:hypothetical protein